MIRQGGFSTPPPHLTSPHYPAVWFVRRLPACMGGRMGWALSHWSVCLHTFCPIACLAVRLSACLPQDTCGVCRFVALPDFLIHLPL